MTTQMTTMLELFLKARDVSVPILAIRTVDPTAVVEAIVPHQPTLPMVQWDAARGITAVGPVPEKGKPKSTIRQNSEDALAAAKIVSGDGSTVGFVEAMTAALALPQKTLLFVHQANRQLTSQEPLATAAAVQAVANLREPFKRSFRMLALLCADFVPPPELAHDVVTIDYQLPDAGELRTIVTQLAESAKLDKLTDAVLDRAVDALSGLSAFAAEQVAVMAMTRPRNGTPGSVDIGRMWERKRVAIEQTPGLGVYRGTETFADIVGADAIKEESQLRIDGDRPLGCVVWIDEIDKAFGNVESDTSGVRLYQVMTLLKEMEDNEWPGFIAVGMTGAGKSLIAKALGNEAGVPNLTLDLGGTESKWIGESEANLRHAIRVIKAVGRGNAYFVATSNAATVMRPELQRRFYDGMWMFDVMTAPERSAAWAFYIKKYNLKATQELPDDTGWTGAEIRNVCRRAAEVKVPILRAARTIIPMAQGRIEDVEALRKFANGRFLDATKGGTYHYTSEPMKELLRAIGIDALPTSKTVN